MCVFVYVCERELPCCVYLYVYTLSPFHAMCVRASERKGGGGIICIQDIIGVKNLGSRAKNQFVDQGDISCEADKDGTVNSDRYRFFCWYFYRFRYIWHRKLKDKMFRIVAHSHRRAATCVHTQARFSPG